MKLDRPAKPAAYSLLGGSERYENFYLQQLLMLPLLAYGGDTNSQASFKVASR